MCTHYLLKYWHCINERPNISKVCVFSHCLPMYGKGNVNHLKAECVRTFVCRSRHIIIIIIIIAAVVVVGIIINFSSTDDAISI